jgi:HEAT repeat protein
MGFKTDTSFLRFLSMGVIGVRQTMKQLRSMGFRPIELERYCASNKLWMTKVKRLRLPDLLCVKTGLRLEVRAKSELRIRMSDAPNTPERRWDSELRDDDVAAFIAVTGGESHPSPADEAVFFSVRALRDSVEKSKLGPPKSASEGAERDRTWPAIIPSCDGTVQSVSDEKLVVAMKTAKGTRNQPYRLKGKKVYVKPGVDFKAEVSILAGAPQTQADIASFLKRHYDPLAGLKEANAVDRYAAVKSLPYRDDLLAKAVPALESLLKTETEERVALEAAGSSATLGSQLGQERIGQVLWGDGRKDLRMEAVLILTELGSPFARAELARVAAEKKFAEDEIRQAAVWGLGKAGLKAYEEILPYIGDPDENLALHAIVAFGSDTPEAVIRQLVAELTKGDLRRAAAASEALRLIANQTVVKALIEGAAGESDWVLATLGRLPSDLVKPALASLDLLKKIAPMLLVSGDANWLASEDRVMDLGFLTKQNL